MIPIALSRIRTMRWKKGKSCSSSVASVFSETYFILSQAKDVSD